MEDDPSIISSPRWEGRSGGFKLRRELETRQQRRRRRLCDGWEEQENAGLYRHAGTWKRSAFRDENSERIQGDRGERALESREERCPRRADRAAGERVGLL